LSEEVAVRDGIATVVDRFTETLGLPHFALYMQDHGGPSAFVSP
jgi:hypothetical protein